MTISRCSACGGETWVNTADTERWFCDCGAEQIPESAVTCDGDSPKNARL